jgi:hypothetical protein
MPARVRTRSREGGRRERPLLPFFHLLFLLKVIRGGRDVPRFRRRRRGDEGRKRHLVVIICTLFPLAIFAVDIYIGWDALRLCREMMRRRGEKRRKA